MESLSRTELKDKNNDKDESMYGLSTGRIENLSDGIFSIAMTILVLDLKAPGNKSTNPVKYIEHMLRLITPMLTTYVIVFTVLAFFWVGHHIQFKYIIRSNRTSLWINILFLMGIAFMPFSTYLMHYFERTPLAIEIFCLNIIFCQLFLLLNWTYATKNYRLVDKNINPAIVKVNFWRSVSVFIITLLVMVSAVYINSNSMFLFFLIPFVQFFLKEKMVPDKYKIN